MNREQPFNEDGSKNKLWISPEELEDVKAWTNRGEASNELMDILRRDLEKERTEKQEDKAGEIRGTGADHTVLNDVHDYFTGEPIYERCRCSKCPDNR